jgi:O-antigen/teichoic acid export membrane protein
VTTGEAPLDVGRRGRDAVLQLFARTVAIRAVTVLGMVVLARILTPADFGVYAVLLVYAQALSLVADAGISASLVQQRDEPSREEIATVWATQQLVWVPIVAATWLLAPFVSGSQVGLGADFEWQLRLTALAIPLTVLRTVPIAMMTRVLRFGELATIEVVMHLSFYATAVVGALAGAGPWSFVFAILAQSAVGALLANLVWRQWAGLGFRWSVARRQLGFGLAFMTANVLVQARDAVVAVFGGLAGGISAIGLLQFSFRVGHVVATVDEIIARVTFPAFSRLQGDPPRVARLMRDAVLVAGLVVGAMQCWLIATAHVLVPSIFGEQWLPAVPAVQLVCLGTLATVPTRFLRTLLFGQGRTRTGLLLAVVVTATMFVIFPVLVATMGLVGGGLAFVVTAILGLWLQVRAVRGTAPFPWLALGRLYMLAALAGVVAWVVTLGSTGVVGTAAASAAFALAYLLLVARFARVELLVTWRLIRGRRDGSGDPEAGAAGAILAADGAPPVRDPGAGAHQRPGR